MCKQLCSCHIRNKQKLQQSINTISHELLALLNGIYIEKGKAMKDEKKHHGPVDKLSSQQ